MKKKNKEKILIGKGSLSWSRGERISDRYGFVGMFKENSDQEVICENAYLDVDLIKSMKGLAGKLFVRVTATRDSTHIGDFFRGLFPQTPNLFDEFTLGHGTLDMYTQEGYDYVGLVPKNEDKLTDWLDAKTLYMVHEQDVELYFIPDKPIVVKGKKIETKKDELEVA